MSSAAVDAAPTSGRPGDLALAPGRGARARECASHRDRGRWDSADGPRDAVGVLLAPNPIRVEDVRLVQSATDIFVGWAAGGGHDYYVRQFPDTKIIANGELISPRLAASATACAKDLARSHARTGDPVAIAAHIGGGRAFDEAMAEFAYAYADQTERDHRQLVAAITSGQLSSAPGW